MSEKDRARAKTKQEQSKHDCAREMKQETKGHCSEESKAKESLTDTRTTLPFTF